MMIYFLAGVASGLMAGVTVVIFSLAGHAWLADRKAKRRVSPSVIDAECEVIR